MENESDLDFLNDDELLKSIYDVIQEEDKQLDFLEK